MCQCAVRGPHLCLSGGRYARRGMKLTDWQRWMGNREGRQEHNVRAERGAKTETRNREPTAMPLVADPILKEMPMDEKVKINCSAQADRDTLVAILARNGYTVRQGREKRGKTSAYTYFVEFWR